MSDKNHPLWAAYALLDEEDALDIVIKSFTERFGKPPKFMAKNPNDTLADNDLKVIDLAVPPIAGTVWMR